MTVRRLFVFVFALSLFTLVVRVTIDTDMWWHLGTGDWILERGIPHGDVFSFTVPGREWITHEWLTQIIMALLYNDVRFPAGIQELCRPALPGGIYRVAGPTRL